MAEVAKMPPIADKPSMEISQKESFNDDKNTPIAKDVRLNSHHHDSEYDTASDDGGDDDDYDDDDDESLGADGEEDESENGSVGFDMERQRGDGQEQEFSKKVDEDRSNPQYIPKKGNFYEHDDRTLDEPEDVEGKSVDGEGDPIKSSTPNISQSSKTMKKWQPASAVDRWSHDRYDEGEQAPKSRQELVSAYGYDIRSEECPPKPRRRRRYGRGPNKYNRNWEDESAYIKPNTNSQRKPRPEDFPALGDRDKKTRKSRSFREEKENRYDRDSERTSTTFNRGTNLTQRDGRIEKRSSGKNFRSGRQSLEFRNQNRNRIIDAQATPPSSSSAMVRKYDKEDNSRHEIAMVQMDSTPFYNNKTPRGGQKQYNDKINNSQHENKRFNQAQNINSNENSEKLPTTSNMTSPIGVQNTRTQVTPTLASRLHQVQNRNDPSHVGSIQMHSIMNHKQQEQQQQQHQQQQQTSEANRTKRYSSLRQRTQNESVSTGPQPIVDQHTLTQQIQMIDHLQPHAPQPQQHVILQDQHLLQANIMQLYHTQDNLQAQLQGVTLQGITGGHQQKPQYQNVQPQYQTPTPAPTYYAPPPAEYPQPTPPAVAPQYTQQPAAAAAYIQPQTTASPMATFSPQPPANGATPNALSYVQAQGPNSAATFQNFTGFQNFNTVGGTTYFVPQQQTTTRPVVLPQRRPTNAIPILAPPNDKQKSRTEKDEDGMKGAGGIVTINSAPLGSAENIDHILDNMFVQRPPLQPPTRKSTSPSTENTGTSTNTSMDDKLQINQSLIQKTTGTSPEISSNDASRLEDGVKAMTLTDDKNLSDQQQPSQPQTINSSVSNIPTPQQLQNEQTNVISNSETG